MAQVQTVPGPSQDAFNTLSEQIVKPSQLDSATLSDLKSSLLSIVSGMSNGEEKAIWIIPRFSEEFFASGRTLLGFLRKQDSYTSSYYFSALLQDSYGYAYEIGHRAGTWFFNTLRNISVAEADVTTSINGNFSVPLSSSDYMLISITVTSPDDVVAIPYKYGTGAGLLGGHAMSCLSAQTAKASTNLHVIYAYVAI